MSSPTEPRPTETQPVSSRDKILDVAEALFAQRGFAGVGLRGVAEAAGLGKSSLFHHFRSKAQLYYEVLKRLLVRFEERFEAPLRADADALERLERCVDSLVDALAESPLTARLLLRALFEDDAIPDPPAEAAEAEAVLARIIGRIQGLLRDGVESGAMRPVSVPETLQTLIGATVYHFASGELGESLLGGPLFSAEAVRRRKAELRSLIHHGLAAPAGPSH